MATYVIHRVILYVLLKYGVSRETMVCEYSIRGCPTYGISKGVTVVISGSLPRSTENMSTGGRIKDHRIHKYAPATSTGPFDLWLKFKNCKLWLTRLKRVQ